MNNLIEKLNGLEPYLASKIKGQDHVLARVCSVLDRGQLGLHPSDKPLGSMLFLGPTGVGKTELVREFSRYLFGEESLFRFDMSELQHTDSVKLFLGDEFGSAGRLGKVLSTHRGGILLFDEIEKAHHLIWDLFLQMLDAARITLADQRTHDLSEFYIVCTSNIGSQQLLRPTRLPFATLERAVLSELQRMFRPEFVGRFDEKIVFRPLSQEAQREIGKLAITTEVDRFREQGFDLVVAEETSEYLSRCGFHRSFGARHMKGVIKKLIGDAVLNCVMSGREARGVLVPTSQHDRLMIVR